MGFTPAEPLVLKATVNMSEGEGARIEERKVSSNALRRIVLGCEHKSVERCPIRQNYYLRSRFFAFFFCSNWANLR